MHYKQQIKQVSMWVAVLSSTNVPIKSIAILINNSPIEKLFIYQFNYLNIKTHKLIKEIGAKVFINEIINSNCNIIIVDKSSYDLLLKLMPYLQHDIIIVLTQEYWIPDWAWEYPQYHFLCQQDLP